jgi:hypothetical protein
VNPGCPYFSVGVEKAEEGTRESEKPMVDSMNICRIIQLLIFAQSPKLFAIFIKWHDNTIVHQKIKCGPDAKRCRPDNHRVLRRKFRNLIVHLFLDEIHVNSKTSQGRVKLLKRNEDRVLMAYILINAHF